MDEPVTSAPPATASGDEAAPEPSSVPERPSRWRWPVRVAAISAVAALLGLLTWGTLSAGRGKSLVAKIVAGEAPAAPHFELDVVWRRTHTWPPQATSALGDGRLGLDELRGRPVAVNFWASWCIPCRDEAPILNASARAHGGEVAFVGIDVQDLRSDALAFLREFEPPYVSVRDRGDRTYEDYGLTGVPETYYLDGAGRIVAHSPGAVSRRTLERGIAAAIGGATR